MNEIKKLEKRRAACGKRVLIFSPLAVFAALLLWGGGVQPTIFRNGPPIPDWIAQYSPEISFREPNVTQIAYAFILFIISVLPLPEIKSALAITETLANAKRSGERQRLEEEYRTR